MGAALSSAAVTATAGAASRADALPQPHKASTAPSEVCSGEAAGAALASAAGTAAASADASAAAPARAPADTGAPTPSKRSLKRAARLAARAEANAARKRARREAERAVTAARAAARNARRDAELAEMEPGAREVLLCEQRERALVLRTAERAEKERVKEVVRSGGRFRVCIDLGWNAAMNDKELRSLAKQIAYSYSAVRKAVEDGRDPLRLSVTGLDTRVEEVMSKHTAGWEDWPILMTKKTLVETHAKADVVYLTHDAEEVLSELHPENVYVIGGIVDRNRLKGATLEKARGLDLKTARLNLDTSVHIGTGTPVLTVNHCVDILLRASHGVSWQEAYMAVLPPRKTLRAVGGGNSSEHPESVDEQSAEASMDGDAAAPDSNVDNGVFAQADTVAGEGDVAVAD